MKNRPGFPLVVRSTEGAGPKHHCYRLGALTMMHEVQRATLSSFLLRSVNQDLPKNHDCLTSDTTESFLQGHLLYPFLLGLCQGKDD